MKTMSWNVLVPVTTPQIHVQNIKPVSISKTWIVTHNMNVAIWKKISSKYSVKVYDVGVIPWYDDNSDSPSLVVSYNKTSTVVVDPY